VTEREREEIALFRYGLISEMVQGELPWGEQARLLEAKARRIWKTPRGELKQVCADTLKGWMKAYRREGMDGLKPKSRKDKGAGRALSEAHQKLLLTERQAYPDLGVPELLRRLREQGLLGEEEALSLSTVYRLVGKASRPGEEKTDRRRWGFDQLLACTQADVLYGPYLPGPDGRSGRQRTYLHAILDDCSRLVLAGEFLFSEKVTAFEQVLKRALLRRGYAPARLYTDNGSAFTSHQLQWVCAQLGIRLLHTEPGIPEGKGKIERFFRTVREQFLAGRPSARSLEELNTAFWEWVELGYHRRPHEGLKGKSPLEVWMGQAVQLCQRRKVQAEELERLFRHRATRLVGKDRVFSFQGKHYQAPVELIGESIEIFYDPETAVPVEICWAGQSYGSVTEVCLTTNQKVGRGLRFVGEVQHA
jgi:transposase InsO family protein